VSPVSLGTAHEKRLKKKLQAVEERVDGVGNEEDDEDEDDED